MNISWTNYSMEEWRLHPSLCAIIVNQSRSHGPPWCKILDVMPRCLHSASQIYFAATYGHPTSVQNTHVEIYFFLWQARLILVEICLLFERCTKVSQTPLSSTSLESAASNGMKCQICCYSRCMVQKLWRCLWEHKIEIYCFNRVPKLRKMEILNCFEDHMFASYSFCADYRSKF